MELIITSKGGKDLTAFCNWLTPQIQEYFINTINPKKLELANIYLNGFKLKIFNCSEDVNISVIKLLIEAINNLILRRNTKTFTIEIDPNISIGNSPAKFIDIVRLVNFGNMSLPAYPILSDTMNYFANNLQYYYNKFLEEEIS